MRKVLVANRGEIAIRIIRSLRELGIVSVAVFTEYDRESTWVRMADFAFQIPSYLDIEAIIGVANEVEADGIHPGYGFLSENSDFALACQSAGIKFIGPTSSALKLVGDKVLARDMAKKVGVPTVPGSDILEDLNSALKVASEIGYPVLLKAAGGGGGKGMRVIRSEEELRGSFKLAKEEAESAFGDPRVFIEKFIENPRHVEVQVLADEHGNAVHLLERDCSLQRRNQKVVEECPAPNLPGHVREKLWDSALKVIKAVGYTNAGTVEFIVDKNFNFYFIEVNARIQVEHPVTELVTGVDIVREQIKIARGNVLGIEGVDGRGHAIEFRVYAEDSDADFAPSPGKITLLEIPQGPGIRFDGWIYQGCEVSPYYDPLLAKIIVWDITRDMAIERARRALSETKIGGIKTNIPFFSFLVELDEFKEGKITTWSMSPILEKFRNRWREGEVDELLKAVVSAGAFLGEGEVSKEEFPGAAWRLSGWKLKGRIV